MSEEQAVSTQISHHEVRFMYAWNIAENWDYIPQDLRETSELRLWEAYRHLSDFTDRMPSRMDVKLLPRLKQEFLPQETTGPVRRGYYGDDVENYRAIPSEEETLRSITFWVHFEGEVDTDIFTVDPYLLIAVVYELLPGETPMTELTSDELDFRDELVWGKEEEAQIAKENESWL